MAAFAAVSFHSVSSRRRSFDYPFRRRSNEMHKGLVENAKREEREALDALRIIRDKQNAKKEEKHLTKLGNKKEGRKGKWNMFKVLFTPIDITNNQRERKPKRSRMRYHSIGEGNSSEEFFSPQEDEVGSEERDRKNYKKGRSYDSSEFRRLVELAKEDDIEECPSPTSEMMRLEMKRSRMMAPMTLRNIRYMSQPDMLDQEENMEMIRDHPLIGSEESIGMHPGKVQSDEIIVSSGVIQRGELVQNRTGAMIQRREMIQKTNMGNKEGTMHLNVEKLPDVDKIHKLEEEFNQLDIRP